MEDLTASRNTSRALFDLGCSFPTQDRTFHMLIGNKVTYLRCLSPRPPSILMYVYSKYVRNVESISLQSTRFSKAGIPGEIGKNTRMQKEVISNLKWPSAL